MSPRARTAESPTHAKDSTRNDDELISRKRIKRGDEGQKVARPRTKKRNKGTQHCGRNGIRETRTPARNTRRYYPSHSLVPRARVFLSLSLFPSFCVYYPQKLSLTRPTGIPRFTAPRPCKASTRYRVRICVHRCTLLRISDRDAIRVLSDLPCIRYCNFKEP